MEDQQPAAGDLTDQVDQTDQTDQTDLTDLTDLTDQADQVDQTDQADQADQAGDDAAEVSEDHDGCGPVRRPIGRWPAVLVAVAATVLVGAAAFAGAAVQPYLVDRASDATRLNVARTAANAITTLWTYTPSNMDNLADRAATYLGGDFEAQYRKFVDAIVAPNKQAKITNTTEVTGVAVESLEGSNAIAIVYTNTTSTSPLTKNIPSLKYLSYRLFMKRDGGRWRVERMTTITSLDLTPHV